MTGPTVLCVGEPLIALTPLPGTVLETAEAVSIAAAGAEANVAVHLSRLGIHARFRGRVGADPFGRRLRATFAGEGVDVSQLTTDPERPTGLYLKNPGRTGTTVHYYRKDSAATRLSAITESDLRDIDHIHLTGITPALSSQCRAVVSTLLTEHHRPISFDINYRRALWPDGPPSQLLLDLASKADIVFVGRDEAAALWNVSHSAEIAALLPDSVELVIKDSGNPVTILIGDRKIVVPALPLDIIEPVGAGDAFAAGYLATRLRGGTQEHAARVGHVLAAGAMSTYGDQGGHADPELLAAACTAPTWPPTPA